MKKMILIIFSTMCVYITLHTQTFTYTAISGGYAVRLTGPADITSVIFPSVYNSQDIKEIRGIAFQSFEHINEVFIPNCVTSI
jgi:hypothetical protein